MKNMKEPVSMPKKFAYCPEKTKFEGHLLLTS